MKSAFEQGEIMQIWKSTIEMEKWFDPAFQEFIDKESLHNRSPNALWSHVQFNTSPTKELLEVRVRRDSDTACIRVLLHGI